MSYIVICQKPDGIEVAAFPGEASPEMLQGAVRAESLDEAAQMVKDVLGEKQAGASEGDETITGENAGNDAPYGGPVGTRDEQMDTGFNRAKKGY